MHQMGYIGGRTGDCAEIGAIRPPSEQVAQSVLAGEVEVRERPPPASPPRSKSQSKEPQGAQGSHQWLPIPPPPAPVRSVRTLSEALGSRFVEGTEFEQVTLMPRPGAPRCDAQRGGGPRSAAQRAAPGRSEAVGQHLPRRAHRSGGVLGHRPDRTWLDLPSVLDLFSRWRENPWLPVAGDGCGNYYVLTPSGEIDFVDTISDPDSLEQISAPDLPTFTDRLLSSEQRSDEGASSTT